MITQFGKRLKKLREKAGISQSELANRAGLNIFAVAKLEQGSREPTLHSILVLARALHMTPGEIIDKLKPTGGKKKPKRPTQKAKGERK